jgi:hypothetical protein
MTIKKIKDILKNITFAPSCLNMAWEFDVKKNEDGFMIRSSFQRPDTHTGEIGRGYGRWMFIDKKTDERGIVMTAWVCAELIVKHELLEAFLFRGARILDPHKSLEDLAYPMKLK